MLDAVGVEGAVVVPDLASGHHERELAGLRVVLRELAEATCGRCLGKVLVSRSRGQLFCWAE